MSTSPQRATILALFREAELDRSRVSLMHTRMPHCPRTLVGDQVDVWLGGLTQAQASEVIDWLQREVA